jgi:hypothetical protein
VVTVSDRLKVCTGDNEVGDYELRLTVPRRDVLMRGREELGVLAAVIRLRAEEAEALYQQLRLERARRTGVAL